MTKLVKIILILCSLISFETHARWATQQETVEETKYYNIDLKVKADGSKEEIVEVSKLITKDAGREIANHILTYNEAIDNIKIIEAYTIVNNVKYAVQPEMMEDKPLASAPQGFDQDRQILISFPNAQIGSTVNLKYIVKSKPLLENFFSTRRWFGYKEYWHGSTFKVTSELPLNLHINDPYKALTVKENTKNNIYNLLITMNKPLCHLSAANSEIGLIDPKNYTWIDLSSEKEWASLAKKISPAYEKVLEQDLPKLFQEIKKAPFKGKFKVDEINKVTKLLSDKIQYMGDWRTINGKFFPRNLAQIANSQLGDCKDFAVSTASILNSLGYNAKIALVYRNLRNTPIYGLPHLGDFNHAIVKVTGKDGDVYWVDPTNEVSMSQGIFPDIANRMALVLDNEAPVYEKIPDINYKFSQIESLWEVEQKSQKLEITSQVALSGEEAMPLTGFQRNHSEKVVKDYIYYLLNNKNHLAEEDKKSINFSDLNSKIVQNLVLMVKFSSNDRLVMTDKGRGVYLPPAYLINTLTSTVPGQRADLYLGSPFTIKNNYIIKRRNSVKENDIDANLNYNKITKWVDIKRSAKTYEDKIEINQELIIKVDRIPNSDLNSVEYQLLCKDLKNYFNGLVLILE